MAKVSCDIQEVIAYLIDKFNEGYTRVELIDDARAAGWFTLNPTIRFIFNEHEPSVVGIDAISDAYRNRRKNYEKNHKKL